MDSTTNTPGWLNTAKFKLRHYHAFDGERRRALDLALPRRWGEPVELTHSPRLCTDDLFTLRRAALQGIGAVLVPHLLVADDMEGCSLVRLLPSLKAQAGIMHAVFPSRRGMVPAVRALLDFLANTTETVRLPPG